MRNNAAYLPESPIVYIILPKSIRNRASFTIFVYEDILEAECLKTVEGSIDPMEGSEPDKDELLQEDTIGILKTALQKAVDEEDYERAAQLRDQINQLKNNL